MTGDELKPVDFLAHCLSDDMKQDKEVKVQYGFK